MSTCPEEPIRLPLPGGGFLRGHLVPGEEATDRVVVYVHGFGSVRSGEKSRALAAACARRRWTFAAFDFRGHGESSGSMYDLRCRTLLDDLEAVQVYLAGRGVRRLCLAGSSMGGWAAAWFPLRHPEVVPACVLLAPSFDFPRGIWTRLNEEQRLAWYQTGRLRVQNEWLDAEISYGLIEEADQFPAEKLIAGWRTPLLIFHGMKDEVIPYGRSLAVVEQMKYSRIEVRLFKEGDHRLSNLEQEIAESACTFFAQ